MLCRRQRRLRIANTPFESKVKVKYTMYLKYVCMARNANYFYNFDQGGSFCTMMTYSLYIIIYVYDRQYNLWSKVKDKYT